jgi:hypothetical protein
MIAKETNIYAEEVFLESSFDKSRISRWKPVTHDQILTFIGLVIHKETIKLNRIQDYWKHHPLFNLKCFSQQMSRDRFLVIMRCLHFARNPPDNKKPQDCLHKIRLI